MTSSFTIERASVQAILLVGVLELGVSLTLSLLRRKCAIMGFQEQSPDFLRLSGYRGECSPHPVSTP